ERVFLRSEEHGPRIITLVELRDEVEARGEVLMTAETRSQLVAAEAVRAEPTAEVPPAEPGEPQAGPALARPHRRRRRRRRGGGAGGADQAGPVGGEPG